MKKKKKKKKKTETIFCEKNKNISFASSIMKNIDVSFSIFPVKLICCIAFGSASSFCCLLESIAINAINACNVPGNSYNLVNIQLCNHLLDQLPSF